MNKEATVQPELPLQQEIFPGVRNLMQLLTKSSQCGQGYPAAKMCIGPAG